MKWLKYYCHVHPFYICSGGFLCQAKKLADEETVKNLDAKKRVAEQIKSLQEKKAKLSLESAQLNKALDLEIAGLQKECR